MAERVTNEEEHEGRRRERVAEKQLQRRLQPREAVDTSAVIRLINLGADFKGRIVDISLGGCHIRTDRAFPVGIFRRVEVEFRIDGLPFRFGGVTQAIYDPVNVGIRFLDLTERRREQLQQLMDEISQSGAQQPRGGTVDSEN